MAAVKGTALLLAASVEEAVVMAAVAVAVLKVETLLLGGRLLREQRLEVLNERPT